MTGPGLQPIQRTVDQPAPRDVGQGLQRVGSGEFSKGGLTSIPALTVQQRLNDPGEGLVNLTG